MGRNAQPTNTTSPAWAMTDGGWMATGTGRPLAASHARSHDAARRRRRARRFARALAARRLSFSNSRRQRACKTPAPGLRSTGAGKGADTPGGYKTPLAQLGALLYGAASAVWRRNHGSRAGLPGGQPPDRRGESVNRRHQAGTRSTQRKQGFRHASRAPLPWSRPRISASTAESSDAAGEAPAPTDCRGGEAGSS